MLRMASLLTLLWLLIAQTGFAQNLGQGFIVKFENEPQFRLLTDEMKPMGNQFYWSETSPQRSVWLQSQSGNIRYIQKNHELSLRAVTSNDPQLSQQWALKSEGAGSYATSAWEVTKGGRDAQNNEIVVAIIDGGFEITHPDLKDNLWVNSNEIPGNGIDDDQNGYVDDVHGWDTSCDCGTIRDNFHGTHVAGIVGATGDNQIGVAGVNWNVKLMVIPSNLDTAGTIKAYNYVVQQKKLWLETGGRLGANIVATNSSFGVDRAKCQSGEFPAWNDLYNQMGELGILSAAATANAKVNVDRKGDVPTSCSSPYIVAVTNTTIDGKRFKHAGFGKKSIDLGAPGTDVLSTISGHRYEKLTGTSMSTPMVAGAIALMHSVLSPEKVAQFSSEPGAAALELKKALLSSVTRQKDLRRKSVSKGRLNIQKAVESAQNL